MVFQRRRVLQSAAALCAISAFDIPGANAAKGPFKASYESFAAGYKTPEWFADAKFGIWAHWSAQCVPEQGDWYARNMYIQGGKQYDYHVRTYGHPSKFGFMEIDNLWKADQWAPEKLMDLYQAAGAKYFMALANHHDNFDAYDSKYHSWNSMNVGPRRDIVGTWAKVARAREMRFGVSNHSARAWHWFQAAYGYDPEGPLAGIRYDAYRLTKADGKGLWWDGLDPQELYTGRNMVVPDGISSIKDMNAWHLTYDRHDTEQQPTATNPGYARKWFLRCQDLIDKYKPDMVYFDNIGLPLGQPGLDVVAHYYNANLGWHKGDLQAVVFSKHLSNVQKAGLTEDVERGFADSIIIDPWQTDTCIGNWHYDRSLFENHRYMSAEKVTQRLADTVSKNGNLLLNIPVRGNGTIDEDEYQILLDLAAWMRINGEAIFGTRPWIRSGEGPTALPSGALNERLAKPFTGQDVRYTRKGANLYVLILGRPDAGPLQLSALKANYLIPTFRAERIEMLGLKGALPFVADDSGVTVTIPGAGPNAFVPVLKISGTGLVTADGASY